MLITKDDALQAIPWEYAHNGEDFLVLEVPFVRGLPADEQIRAPELRDVPLHIVAIPSNPIAKTIAPLNIAGEWQRLQEIVAELPQAVTLERTNPPTVDALRKRVSQKQHRIVHFMGHGGEHDNKAVLFFENEQGGPEPVSAKDVYLTIKGSAFLVMLNACVSAMPGKTEFSNLATALVKRKIPYALGMRFSIPDADALAFSRAFYTEIAAGAPVEDALFQARRSMMRKSAYPWVVGVPVLYTALGSPAAGFSTPAGEPGIEEGQPPMEVGAIPRAEGAFQGRVPELLKLGEQLTGDQRAKLYTIHGGGGQGKSALAREAVERCAHAWPGGVWAITLENLPTRIEFVTRLGRFLNVPGDDLPEPDELERRVLNVLRQRRVLLVLDNAETLVEAVERQEPEAHDLVKLLREQIGGTPASMLVTSRYYLGWVGEEGFSLGGLTPAEGAALFLQSAPQRRHELSRAEAEDVSRKVEGHPLALRLLGLAFNETPALGAAQLAAEYEEHLAAAKDKYRKGSHRHHSIFASIETSVRHLDTELRALLSGLWVFEAPFLPETAAEIFASLAVRSQPSAVSEDEIKNQQSAITNHLHRLYRRGLLAGEQRTFREGTLWTCRLLPTMRPYSRQMEQAYPQEELLARFGAAYAGLAHLVYRDLDRGGALVWLADQARGDFERGMGYLEGEKRGWYQNYWGWVLHRLGDRVTALTLMQTAKEQAEGQDQRLELQLINNMAGVYSDTGKPEQALALYEQALPIMREVGDRAGEAATMNNMGSIYFQRGELDRTAEMLQKVIRIAREIGAAAQEAGYMYNLAVVLSQMNRVDEAAKYVKGSIGILRTYHLHQAASGATLSQHEQFLAQLESGGLPANTQDQSSSLSDGVAQGGGGVGEAAEAAEEAQGAMAAIRAYLSAESLEAMQQAVETHQEALFSPEVQGIFQANIEQARQSGENEAAEMMGFHLALLEACQSEGIAAAFAALEQATQEAVRETPATATPPAGLPDGFIEMCVRGLSGGPQEKQALFNALVKLAPRVSGAGELIQAVQQAIFGADLSTLGGDLSGEYVQLWAQIVAKVAQ